MRVKRLKSGDEIFKQDKLNRNLEIETFLKIIRASVGPYVISIDAPWGTGKTVFVEMLLERLKEEENIKTLYINAWKDDYKSDPIVSILAGLSRTYSNPKQKLKRVYNKSDEILKASLPSLVKAASGHLIDIESISDALKDVTEKLIEQNEKKSEAIKELTSELRKLLDDDEKTDKVVVFIDELDRCRPSYSIEFLERVKHLFDIEGFIFVISTHKSELLESFKAVYGSNFNSHDYLRRFIDFDFKISQNITEDYVESIFEVLGLKKVLENLTHDYHHEYHLLKKQLTLLARLNSFSARDINQILSKFILIVIGLRKGLDVSYDYILTLVVLQHKVPKKFESVLNGNFTAQNILDSLNILDFSIADNGGYNLRAIISSPFIALDKDESFRKELFKSARTDEGKLSEIGSNEKQYAIETLDVLKHEKTGWLSRSNEIIQNSAKYFDT